MARNRTLTPLERVIGAIEEIEPLDAPAKSIAKKVRDAPAPTELKDALSGTQLGHALHPLLTDAVIGFWISANALDVVGGRDSGPAAERLIALGIAAYLPTALTGASDWADAEPGNAAVRRVGVVHAVSNSLALGLYGASLRARRRGERGKGAALGFLGAGALGLGGFLGGHLSYAEGIGVDQTIFDPGPEDWTPAGPSADLVEAKPMRVVVDESPVLLLRRGERIHALHDRCSHRGCSLTELGEVAGDEIVCNCHGSRFSLEDGALLRGPATRPQPAFEARERDGVVELRALQV